jgi:two-component system, cell cycle response regulator CpdR
MPTVLVAEDDPQVLELVARILRRAGYEAITARDGREAWAIFQRDNRPIDLLLADVVMPYMTGTELAARIAGRAPDLPIVLISGFTPEDLGRRGLVLSHGHLLTKPFTHGELLDIVRRLVPP